ncbi:hypothetical protein [Glycomyces artemisiae]|uniref:Uncharacterized protein n=1 Tax=Glycomyces artemisiae TaxID=1076443 RepID=A0A2T0UFJ7_9ACTN|nr:hypothetical protein [Glycomyces artemisiae]PRY56725.1 hypothetical protein B0I28_10836 [Glycomyces artemisiae]
MSQQQLLPPPVDWMQLRYGAVPVPAGPGGAYAPPVPGGSSPMAFTMRKPRNVAWVQTLLWVFAAVTAVVDLLTAIVMTRDFHPLSLAGLAYALYATIQSLVTPMQIGRGKRWAWVWALTSAVIGFVLAVGTTMAGMTLVRMAPGVVPFAAVVGVLYLVLILLLCSKPLREWMLMHRAQRGQARMEGAPGPGMALSAVYRSPQRTIERPRSLSWAQVVFWMVALMPLAWAVTGVWAVAATAALAALALTSSIGLNRGRFWARVFTLVWLSAVGIASGGAIVPGVLLATGTFGVGGVEMQAGMAVALSFGLGFVLACIAFGLMFTTGVRRWTPPAELVLVFREAAVPQQVAR